MLEGLWGGHFSVRRSDWERAEELAGTPPPGSIDEAARHIDAALGLRLRGAGLEGVFDQELVAAHRHRRELSRVYGDSHSLAYGRVCLHLAYPDLAGTPEAEVEARSGSRPAARLVRSRAGNAVGRGVAAALARLAAIARFDSLELLGIRALAVLGFAMGVEDARRDLGRPAP